MSEEIVFECGKAYIATPAMRDASRVFLACVDRTPSEVVLADVRGLYRARVRVFDGRETAQLQSADGHVYMASATVAADIANVATYARGCDARLEPATDED